MKRNEKLWLKIMITDNWLATPKSLLKKIYSTYDNDTIFWSSKSNQIKWTQMKELKWNNSNDMWINEDENSNILKLKSKFWCLIIRKEKSN